MSNAVTTINPRPKSVTMDMAERFGMDHQAFERTLRATVFPSNAPAEEFAAFLLVAKEYKLNPITKEIYAFPKKGGGIVPVVSIDGWMNLINSHPAFDGMDFDETHNDKGDLICIRCTIFRKDRSHPISVTEYLSECIRATDPWKMKHRMLRHKAAIQCARYAFGFAGIYEEDEAERIAASNARDVSPPVPPMPPIPIVPALAAPQAVPTPPVPTPVVPEPPMPSAPAKSIDPEAMIAEFREAMDAAEDAASIAEAWDDIVSAFLPDLFPPDVSVLEKMRDDKLRRLG